MIKPVVLDSGPLGKIAHPRPNQAIAAWLAHLLTSGVVVILPEIADYEVRRGLLLSGLNQSVSRLDQLKQVLTYLPLNTQMMLKQRNSGLTQESRGSPLLT